VWNLATNECQKTITAHDDPVSCLELFDDYTGTQRLISGSRDSTLKLWDLQSYDVLHIFAGHNVAVTCLAVYDNGMKLISGSDDHTMIIWSLGKRKECLYTIRGHQHSVFCVKVFDNNRQCISGSADNHLKGWVLSN
jgi:WD40 repeat protein